MFYPLSARPLLLMLLLLSSSLALSPAGAQPQSQLQPQPQPQPGMPAPAMQDLAALGLAQAQRLALERNPDLRAALAALQGAQAAVRTADNAPNPVLTLQTMNINPSQGIGPGSLRAKAIDSAIRIDQQIERGGKRLLRVRNAQFLEQAARADLGEVRRQLRLAVAQAYYDLLAAQDKRDILQESVRLFEQTMEAARRRRKAGDIAGADVDRLQVDALRAANDAEAAEADLLRAQETLSLALGSLPQPRLLRAADPWPDAGADAGAIDATPSLAVISDNRPDVRAAASRLRAAEEGLRMALALRTRDVTVGLQAEHYPQNGNNLQGTGNSFGIAVQIPLFLRNQYQGEIANAEAALEGAREALDKVRNAARSELSRSRDEARIAASRLRRYDLELLPAAERSAEAAEYAFRNGAIGVMDVLDARRTRRATLLEAAAARADHARALAAWQVSISAGEAQ